MRVTKLIILLLVCSFSGAVFAQPVLSDDVVHWQQTVTISNELPPSGADSTWGSRAHFGAQYTRLLRLSNGTWLAGYTVAKHKGYAEETTGGLSIQVSQSTDGGHTWTAWSAIAEPGRDVDNAQLIQLTDGSVLLAARSVRWHESYRLPVYKSTDKGKSWQFLSTIDASEGKAVALKQPDRGLYEPHFYTTANGRLAVQYASEKYAAASVPYSQVIAQKTSANGGKTWSQEQWVVYDKRQPSARPGMPVCTKMKNGQYIVVYEVCGPQHCEVYYKISHDGERWPEGLGRKVPGQKAAPFVASIGNGALLLTSNNSEVSVSEDYGTHWRTIAPAFAYTLWPAIYDFGNGNTGVVSAEPRPAGGHAIQIRLGTY